LLRNAEDFTALGAQLAGVMHSSSLNRSSAISGDRTLRACLVSNLRGIDWKAKHLVDRRVEALLDVAPGGTPSREQIGRTAAMNGAAPQQMMI